MSKRDLKRAARDAALEAGDNAIIWDDYAKELRGKGLASAAERVERSARQAHAEAEAFFDLSR